MMLVAELCDVAWKLHAEEILIVHNFNFEHETPSFISIPQNFVCCEILLMMRSLQ